MAQVTPKAVTLSEGSGPMRCACGVYHHKQKRPRRRPGPADHSALVSVLYDAQSEGKASVEGMRGEWLVHYSGNCERPHRIRRVADRGALLADFEVRCRQCPPCLRARSGFWMAAAVANIKATMGDGRRVWFGTLTLRPDWQQALVESAVTRYAEANGGRIPFWWDDPHCDERFRLVRELLVREVQLYWKRLRKAGHCFSYLVAFERHKSGLPHIHFLLHEAGSPITKAKLESPWGCGFAKAMLVGGKRRGKQRLSPEYCAWYVAKYLMKDAQARQIASAGYSSIIKHNTKN